MTKILTAACAVLLLGAPTVAFADDAMKADQMMMKPGAMMICREAKPNEKGTAMMMSGHMNLTCKSITAMMHDGKVTGPDLSKALTTEQVSAAWQAWIAAQFSIPATPGGG